MKIINLASGCNFICFRQWRCTKKKFLGEKSAYSRRWDESHAATRSFPLLNLLPVHNPAHRTAVDQSTTSSWTAWATAWRYLKSCRTTSGKLSILTSNSFESKTQTSWVKFDFLSPFCQYTGFDFDTLFCSDCIYTAKVSAQFCVEPHNLLVWISTFTKNRRTEQFPTKAEVKFCSERCFCCRGDANRKCRRVHWTTKTEVTLQ